MTLSVGPFVAVDAENIVGTAKMGPNRAGPGSHVAAASFMVAADARGRGVGMDPGAFPHPTLGRAGLRVMYCVVALQSDRMI